MSVGVVDANGESKDKTGKARRKAASSRKLAAMMSDRIHAINDIRGLLEREHMKGTPSHHEDQFHLQIAYSCLTFHCNHSAENDQLDEMMMLRRDVKCQRQANTELKNTVIELKTKNGDYAQKLRQLSIMVDKLICNDSKNIQRISVLEDDVAAKNIMIDEERSSHEREIEEMRKILEVEKENNASVVRKLEETLENVTARMTAEMSAQKASIANLTKSLDEATLYRRDVSNENKKLQTKIDEVKRSVAQSANGLAGAIGKLEVSRRSYRSPPVKIDILEDLD